MKDSVNNVFVLSANEWARLVVLSPVLCKYVICLFYERDNYKSFVRQLLTTTTTGSYELPSTVGDNTMYERLVDELVMNRK